MPAQSSPAMQWALLTVALVLLNLSLTFVSIWPTLGVRAGAQLSLEAAVLVLGLAVVRAWRGRPVSARTRTALAAIWVALVIGRYVDVSTRSLYGRSVNLYWDLKLLPDVGAMFAFVARPAMLAAAAVAVVLVPVLIYLPVRWAIGRVANACNLPLTRRALIATALLILTIAVVRGVDEELFPQVEFAPPVSLAFAGELTEFAREATGLAVRPLPPAPDVLSDLAYVQGADVFVLFVESYGAASWERPEFQAALAPSRAQLSAAIRESGRSVATAFVDSTTFGGESWLAHISLLSGTEVRDPDVNMRLMAEHRDTMVTAFARRGYTTSAIMPGLLAAWPDGAFYGFDRIYGAADLKYGGPPFGWWDVTDQFVIARMDELVIAPRPRPPAFVFLPTISTHAPFAPVPPYQPDWSRIFDSNPYDPDSLEQAWDATPDWDNLGPDYARAMAYVHHTLGGYLRLRADRDFVMVILGDHQPPALVSGEGASWAVPVHVVTGRAEVLARLRQQGFRDGLVPTPPSVARMDTLMRVLLDAFGNARFSAVPPRH